MSEHIVSSFSSELEGLSADILRMGGMTETMITDACAAVTAYNKDQARAVIERDVAVDELHANVERRITDLLALRQPLATDLRAVLGAFKVSGDLERIGDLSKSIAKRTLELNSADSIETLKRVSGMGRAASLQLQAVLDAYSAMDAEQARRVWNADLDIDQMYNSLFRETLTYMMEDPRTIGAGAHLMFIAKNLERIGDHCTNIAEVVFYQATGRYMATEDRPKAPLIDS